MKALPGNHYDGHTLGKVLPGIEARLARTSGGIVADCGYRGHNAPPDVSVTRWPPFGM
jgi:IS5 family transposase